MGNQHTIRRLDNHSLPQSEYVIPAVQVDEGTNPKGSMWRRCPIPACNCDSGKLCGVNKTDPTQPAYPAYFESYGDTGEPVPKGTRSCPTGTQFPVPCPMCYGQDQFSVMDRNMWAIVDEVEVPLLKGSYVLRWRWDTEQNQQIWTHCADVNIV